MRPIYLRLKDAPNDARWLQARERAAGNFYGKFSCDSMIKIYGTEQRKQYQCQLRYCVSLTILLLISWK